jgi:hypothetical protein
LSWLQELGCRTSGLQQALGSHNQPVIHHIYRAQKEAASKKKATLKQTNKIAAVAAVAAAAAGGTTSCDSGGRRSPDLGAIAEAPAHIITDHMLVRTAPPTFSPCPLPSSLSKTKQQKEDVTQSNLFSLPPFCSRHLHRHVPTVVPPTLNPAFKPTR